MSLNGFRIILAVIPLGLATYIVVLNYALPSVCIINKIRKTKHRAPSGVAIVTAILAALALSVGKQSRVICYWAIGIVVFDPMNWFILAVGLREALGRVRKGS
jgi:hypothetical protein